MAHDVSKTVAFLATYCQEFVQLQKPTLESLLKSNRASKVKEWNAAKNFWHRKVPTLAVEQRQLLEDWESVLCDMSRLDAVAFLSRMESCFARGHQFFLQKAECIQQLGAATLESVLRSREVKSDPMAVFMLVLLERYSESFTPEHKETIAMWEAQFCRIGAEAQQRVRRTRTQAFARAEEFVAKFAAEIAQLQKQTLRNVVMSNQANSYVEWKQGNNFFVRDFHLLTVEERDLLEDWEFVLCKMSTLEAVAFLPCLQRCFKQLALRSRHMLLQFPMSYFWNATVTNWQQSKWKLWPRGKNCVNPAQPTAKQRSLLVRQH